MENEQLDEVLHWARASKRVCPVPQKWNELWKLLPQRRRVGVGWEPPLPLILAAWWHTSDDEKRNQFFFHIRWAADHGALETVSAFLNSLEPEHWHCSE
jgi:hypothetical protein